MIWVGIVVACLGYARGAFENRGQSYALTDFLISYAEGPVRRGLTGSIAISLADTFRGTPSAWAWVLGTIAMLALAALVVSLVRRLPRDPALTGLVLSPAGIMFFVYDQEAAMRKEVIVYVALGLILRGAFADGPAGMRRWSAAGAALYVMSIWSHEAMIFLFPAVAAGILLSARPFPAATRWSLGLISATAVGALLSLGIILTFPMRDVARLCRAADYSACAGAFKHMGESLSDALQYVRDKKAAGDAAVYGVLGLLAVLPLLGVRVSRRSDLFVVPFLVVAVVPLFFVGQDWGRWLDMAVFPMTMLAMTQIALGEATYRSVMSPWTVLIYVGSWNLPLVQPMQFLNGVRIWPVIGILALGVLLRASVRRITKGRSEP